MNISHESKNLKQRKKKWKWKWNLQSFKHNFSIFFFIIIIIKFRLFLKAKLLHHRHIMAHYAKRINMNLKMGMQLIFGDKFILQLREFWTLCVNETADFHYPHSITIIFGSEIHKQIFNNSKKKVLRSRAAVWFVFSLLQNVSIGLKTYNSYPSVTSASHLLAREHIRSSFWLIMLICRCIAIPSSEPSIFDWK